jgi:hypothetical protein
MGFEVSDRGLRSWISVLLFAIVFAGLNGPSVGAASAVIDGPNELGAVNANTKGAYSNADLYDPATNVSVATKLLELKLQGAGDIRTALMHYYGSKNPAANARYADQILAASHALEMRPADPVLTLHNLMDPKPH